jgi:hypothetical protein
LLLEILDAPVGTVDNIDLLFGIQGTSCGIEQLDHSNDIDIKFYGQIE